MDAHGAISKRLSSRLSSEARDFIDGQRIHSLLGVPPPDASRVRDVVAKSLAKQALDLEETATLLRARDPESVSEIFAAARALKERVYGRRIVLFAPLYVGNRCVNDCRYCAFRRSNRTAERLTLGVGELREQVASLERSGHKRLILVFGEHPQYSPERIAESVRTVYATRGGHDEIRRVNINAAPLTHEGFATVRQAGIGTYQIFMETYHHAAYARWHPRGTPKSDYLWRLDGLSRAMEAGCDDVGIGALFGLYDWRFEVLGLVSHALHLQSVYGVGPHTISFPRLRPAHGVTLDSRYRVSDEQLARVVAILRLAVPYTGLILTAREPAALRRELLGLGVSQIDAGSRIDLGGYAAGGDGGAPEREQFELGDRRSLDEVMRELLEEGYLPSFCTACYRLRRTGEHFMELAVPGFIERFCTPNALTTLAEFLADYASAATRAAGERVLARCLAGLEAETRRWEVGRRLVRIEQGERDLYF